MEQTFFDVEQSASIYHRGFWLLGWWPSGGTLDARAKVCIFIGISKLGMSRSLSLQEGVVLFQLLIQGFQADSYVRVKDFGPDFSAGDGPVADDLAVEEDDGPEDAGVVVGAVGVVGVEYDVAAFVSDEVFVVGGQEGDGAAAEAAGAAVLMAEEAEAFPALFDEFALDGVHCGFAVADVQSGPPHEVFQGGGAVAAEILSCQPGQGFVPGDGILPGQFVIHQGVAVLHREEVSAAQQARILRQADVVGKPVFVHGDALVFDGIGKIGLPGDAVPAEVVAEDLLNGILLFLGNAYAVGFHPADHAAQGVGAAKLQRPAPVLSGYQLPGSAEQMAPDDFSAVVVCLERLGGRLLCAHSNGPAHHPVLLCLHRAHPPHHIVRRAELRAD